MNTTAFIFMVLVTAGLLAIISYLISVVVKTRKENERLQSKLYDCLEDRNDAGHTHDGGTF